jgi:hypothetical protein
MQGKIAAFQRPEKALTLFREGVVILKRKLKTT